MKHIMKKRYWVTLVIVSLLLISIIVLNKTVTTSQGVNYKVSRLEIPLYLKISNFFDRHFSMKWLANHITTDSTDQNDRILSLFKWTYTNVNRQPESVPVMDDHVWNVYVRRYGVSDNFHDLFTTLNSYIGINAFFMGIHSEKAKDEINLSFIQLEKGWVVFDPFNGVYFTNKSGDWATVEDIKSQNWKVVNLQGTELTDSYYKPFLEELPDINETAWKRANIQSPVNRLKFQFDKWFSGENALLE